MAQILVVTNEFGEHRRGTQIADPAVIAEIMASHNAANVVRVEAPDVTPAQSEEEPEK